MFRLSTRRSQTVRSLAATCVESNEGEETCLEVPVGWNEAVRAEHGRATLLMIAKAIKPSAVKCIEDEIRPADQIWILNATAHHGEKDNKMPSHFVASKILILSTLIALRSLAKGYHAYFTDNKFADENYFHTKNSFLTRRLGSTVGLFSMPSRTTGNFGQT